MNDYDETVSVVRDLIRIDTSNPPGNEEGLVQYLEAFLKKEGFATEILSPRPKRASIVARLRGKRRDGPIVLLSHIDVVPAHEEGWVEPPFSGAVKDGFIYGRGAIDMKSQVAFLLMAFTILARQGVVPERDILFLATADEETGGEQGIDYVLSKVKELHQASFVLSEGGFIVEEKGLLHARISVTEKQICQFAVRARGTGGHASMPHPDNANNKLVRACERIIAHKEPLRPPSVVAKYLEGVLLRDGIGRGRRRFGNLTEALKDEGFRASLEANREHNALLRNTVTLTMLQAGEKVNVIPLQAQATFDGRILPGEQHERFMKRMAKLAAPDAEVTLLTRSDSRPSGFRTPYFRQIARVVAEMKGQDIPSLPFLSTGATDLRAFRALGIPAYGFFPVTLNEDEHFRMHSVNERISLENVREGADGTRRIVEAVASLQ